MNTVRPRRDPGRGYAYGGPALIGGIIVGLGLGILLDDFFAWFLIGIGAGFILMGSLRRSVSSASVSRAVAAPSPGSYGNPQLSSFS